MDFLRNLTQTNIFSTGNIAFFALVAIILLVIIFIFFRILRKSGLLLLMLTFLIDNYLKIFQSEIYQTDNRIKIAIICLYILSIILFLFKIQRLFKRKEKISNPKLKKISQNNRIRKFRKFTGCTFFIIMLIINIIDFNNLIPSNIKSTLTSLSFLYMAFRTLLNTYRYINDNDHIKMPFDFKDEKRAKINRNKNRIRKQSVNLNDRKEQNKVSKTMSNEDKKFDPKKFSFYKKTSPKEEKITKEITCQDFLYLVTRGFDDPINTTTISITNLQTGENFSYTSKKCIAHIEDDKEYKVDLEFENINDYDYGRFVDILRIYSENKKQYKFQLDLMPYESDYSKVVLYDPSEIFDIKEEDTALYQGRNLSMNFPKYKINFIQGK
ncbi:MAG: hypothetical protein Q4B52_02000 [Tissierellia bacterium]|nr:hypothetical protein [Tissierellia bacterium]